MQLGDIVKSKRQYMNLSQEELADLSGVSRYTVSQLESNSTKYPRKKTLTKLSEVFGFNLRDRESWPGELGSSSNVDHPSHYNHMPIETFEMFLLRYHDRPDYIKGALLFNIDKYRDRSDKKNGEEDIDKLNWYLDKFEMLFGDDINLYQLYHSSKQVEDTETNELNE